MNRLDEIRKKVDDLTDEAFAEGYKIGYEKGMKVTEDNYLAEFLEWLNSEVAIIGKDQDGKTHILVARRVQEDPQKLVWADAVQEFNLRNQDVLQEFPVDPVDPKKKIKLNHPSDQMEEEEDDNANRTR